MAEIRPFAALRYTDAAGDVSKNVCPPYDIISESERLAFLEESENNIIRLELPKGDSPYEEAARSLRRMEEDGILAKDDRVGLYIYEEEFTAYGEKKKVKGIYSLVKLCEFSEGVVLPHEETLSKAKEDRFNLMSTTFCNFSAIYSMYTDEERIIRNKIDELSARTPDVEFPDKDGIIQRLWCVYDEEAIALITKAFADKKLYIADGHHRYETALRFRKKLIADGVITSPDHKGNYCMMMLVDIDHEGLVVFPTHRLLKYIPDFDFKRSLDKIKEYFTVEKLACTRCLERKLSESTDKTAFGCFDGETPYLLTMKEDEATKAALSAMLPGKSEAYKSLDVAVLHSLILEKVFGIDKENMANQLNLTYTRSSEEAFEGVKNGAFQCAFLLNPTKVRQIKDVALADEKMPQKSTYFYPKLITGLVMNELEPLK